MGRIRILSDNVANKIAAGEVVERPASVVKELLENALDAGATDVTVELENAGRRLIRIQDDGCGMLRDDALLAFERHATSKLSEVKDLLAIETLGFRGEALPSIAAVSRLLLETRSEDERTGTAVEILGGKLVRCDEIARVRGTTIQIRDLFYNVPARKKFLRSDQTELAHIATLFTHYSLGHPAKRFELHHERRELLNVTPVDTLRERAFQVFGSELVSDLINMPPHEFTHEEAHYVLEGLISPPHVQKQSRASLYLFVNGRLIRDKMLQHAVHAAYHNLMPSGCFPFALLFLNCDPSEVDVNVHPAKTEVRFRHSSQVHDFVQGAIRDSLMASRPISNIPTPGAFRSPLAPSEFTARIEQAAYQHDLAADPISVDPSVAHSNGVENLLSEEGEAPEVRIPSFALTRPPVQSSLGVLSAQPSAGFESAPNPVVRTQIQQFGEAPRPVRRSPDVPDTHGPLLVDGDEEIGNSLAVLPQLRPLGQLHDSFIIAAGRDGIWLIDQHVAHERILFEQVLRQRASGSVEVQQLLLPLVVQLTPGQQFEYARIADELAAHGFDTEPFGQRTIAIKAAPAAIGPQDLERVILEILEVAERELRTASLDEIRRSVCASIACRAAIKIHTRLDQAKMEWLLKALGECEYPMTCPHGRPIALRYSTREILKSFHRI